MTVAVGTPLDLERSDVPAVATAAPELVDVLGNAGRQRRHINVPRSIQRLTGPLLLLATWQVVAVAGIVGPDTMPAPRAVVDAAVTMVGDGSLQGHLWASLNRVARGLALGLSAGLVLALIAGLFRIGENLVDANMEILRAVPNFALLPLLIIWFGIDEQPKVILISLSVVVAIYINSYSAIRNIDSSLIEAGRTFGLNRLGLIRYVILPGMVPGFLVGLRLALTGAWLGLIFAETVNARQGIGRLMTDAREHFQLDVIFVILAIYALLGLASISTVRFLENRLLVWRRTFEGS